MKRWSLVAIATFLAVPCFCWAFANFDLNAVKTSKFLYELPRKNLYAIGTSEDGATITIINGNIHNARVTDKNEVKVDDSFKTKTSHLVFSNVRSWNEVTLPSGLKSKDELSAHVAAALKKLGYETPGTVPILLKGRFAKIEWHLDRNGTPVRFTDEKVDVLAFGYMTGTKFEMHMAADKRGRSGVLDEWIFLEKAKSQNTMTLFLPR